MKGGWTLAHGGGARDGTVRCLGSEDGTGEVGDAVGFDQRMIAHLHKHRFRNGRRGPCLIRGAVGTKSSYCIEHPRFAKVRASANIKNRQGCNNAARMRVCEVLDPVRKAEPGVEALQLPVADLNCHASRRFEAQKRAINHDSLVPKGRPPPPPPPPFTLTKQGIRWVARRAAHGRTCRREERFASVETVVLKSPPPESRSDPQVKSSSVPNPHR